MSHEIALGNTNEESVCSAFSWPLVPVRPETFGHERTAPQGCSRSFPFWPAPLRPDQAVPVWIPVRSGQTVQGRGCWIFFVFLFCESCPSHSGDTFFPLPSANRLERWKRLITRAWRSLRGMMEQISSITARKAIPVWKKRVWLCRFSTSASFMHKFKVIFFFSLLSLFHHQSF